MDVLTIFATRLRGRTLFCAAVILAALIGIRVSGQGTTAAPTQQLYLLAGTPVDGCDCAATLYRSQGGRLKRVREIVSPMDGLSFVRAWGNAIFLVYPQPSHISKTVTIIHTDNPLRLDSAAINPNISDLFVDDDESVISEAHPPLISELLWTSKLGSDGSLAGNTLLAVPSVPAASGPRPRLAEWSEYTSLRIEGNPGGPAQDRNFTVDLRNDHLVLFPGYFGASLILDTLPPALHQPDRPVVIVIAANQRYLLLNPRYTPAERASGKKDNQLFVHDRMQNHWKTIQVEGSEPRARLFGSWLANIVEMPNPDRKPSPGRENERGPDYTRTLPNVRDLYGGWPILRPGILVLQNIEDDRKIRIETDQEDSEILKVNGDKVLYRVNDTIYQAQIAGNQLQNTSVIVKDEDVPEVHWVFWSNH